MKKNIIKCFIVLAIMLGFCNICLPVVAAGDVVATIGNTQYTSLEDAISKVKKNQTIKLQKNVTIYEKLCINKNVKFTLDFNNKKITSRIYREELQEEIYDDAYWEEYWNNWTEDEEDDEEEKPEMDDIIISKGNVTFVKCNLEGGIKIEKNGKFTLKSGKLNQLVNYGSTSIKNGTFREYGEVELHSIVNYSGKLNITKADVKADGQCVRINGGEVTISGGTYRPGDFSWESVIWVEKGKLTIKGGKFKEGGMYTLFNAGTTVISGGTFSNVAEEVDFSVVCNSGKMTVKGGTFKTLGLGPALQCYYGSNTYITKGTFSTGSTPAFSIGKVKKFKMTGGTVKNTAKKTAPVACSYSKKTSKVSIKSKCIKTPCKKKIKYGDSWAW